MTARKKAFAALAALIVLLSVIMAGCTNLQGFTRTADGKLSYPEGDNTWSWKKNGGAVHIELNGKPFATLERGVADITLPDNRKLAVTLNKAGAPATVQVPWDTELRQADYDLVSSAFNVNTQAGGIPTGVSWGWVLVLALLLVAGVLLSLFAGRVVESAKGGGIFSGTDTAKSLLIFRAGGVAVALLALVALIAVASA